MNKKIKYVIVGIILFSLGVIPSLESMQTTASYNIINQRINLIDKDIIKLAVIHSRPDGHVNFSIKELFKEEYLKIRENITKKISLTESPVKTFENILGLIKEKNLINDNINLHDIFGNKTSIIYN